MTMSTPKFKETEIGTIPKEWGVKNLGDIVDITSSKRIFMSEYTKSGVPFWRGKEIVEKANGAVVLSTPLYISEHRFSEIADKFGIPQEGDILMGSVGTLGVSYQVKKNEKFYFKDGNITWFKNYSQGIFPPYIQYWLRSSIGQRSVLSTAIGSTQPALTIDGLKRVPLAIPDEFEQKQIVEILSSLDDKIELNRKINTNLEKLASSLFKKWFVDIGDNLPEGWRMGKISDISDITIGRTPPRMQTQWFSENTKDVKWISIRDLGISSIYINKTAEYLTKDAIDKFNIPVIPKNTVILSFKLTVGRVAITTEDMLSNEAIAHIKLKNNKLSPEYIYLMLKKFDYSSLGSTSSIAIAVNSKMIKNMPVLIPDEKTIKKFTELVGPLFADILERTNQIDSLTEIRDSLLSRLMSGKIRVKNYD